MNLADAEVVLEIARQVNLMRPKPGDVLVLTGVEFARDSETGDPDFAAIDRLREYLGCDVKVLALANPDATARLERPSGEPGARKAPPAPG